MSATEQKSKAEVDIDTLDDIPGVGDVSIAALHKNGLYTKTDLLCSNPIEIAEITGMDRDKANNMFAYCRKLLEDAGILGKSTMSFWEALEARQKLQKIKTGCNALDDLLGGGIECKAITEFYGQFGAGKTQLSHTVATLVQRPISEGGLSEENKPARVLYIDTERTSRPERIKDIVIARGLAKEDEPEKIKSYLDNIMMLQASNAGHQMLLINNAVGLIKEFNIRLIIVDSGTALFRAEMTERGNLSRKQQQINKMLHKLQNMSEVFNLAVIFINQVYGKPEETFGEKNEYASGGNIVGHGTTYRINLSKVSRKKWAAEMVDSPMTARDSCLFALDKAGIIDFVETKKKSKEA